MMNMQNMMRQAQKLQKQMEQSQAELAAMQFVGKSAQDLVQATLTGDKKVVSIDFNPAVVDPEDLETLSDMTVQAINSALEQIDETTKKKIRCFRWEIAILSIRKTSIRENACLSWEEQLFLFFLLKIKEFHGLFEKQFSILWVFLRNGNLVLNHFQVIRYHAISSQMN